MSERTADREQEQTAWGERLTTREAAAALGLQERTIRRAIGRGELMASKRGGVFQIVPRDLAQYRETHLEGAYSKPRTLRLVPLPRRESTAAGRVPTPLTTFIGREREVAVVQQLLRQPDVRSLTLTGPGGVGKTRLALAVAAGLGEHFADGVAFVSLAPVRDPGLVSSAIAQALGVREPGRGPLDEALRNHLRRRELLLILDNFEHLLPAAAFVVDLLTACQSLKVLVTSRTVLRMYGERDLPVPTFALPNVAQLPVIEELGQYAVVRLFTERAQAAHADFALTAENAAAVAAICHRLDGLPLAVELAAARSKLLPPQALLDRLDRRLTILSGGAKGQPARLRSLREAIAWSHDLLTEEEQALFLHLAVFVGGFTLDAAEWVSGSQGVGRHSETLTPSSGPPTVLDTIASLLDKSLLRRIDGGDGEPRLGMLETIHEFALERLATSGEDAPARRRHADFFLTLAERSEPEFYGSRQADAFALLTREHANLRAALAWTLESGESLLGLRLAVALGRFWHIGGHLGERQRWLEQILAQAGAAPPPLRAKALCLLGDGAYDTGDLTTAQTFYERSFAIASEANDRQRTAEALLGLGGIAADREGDLTTAEAHFARSLALREETGDRWGAALMHLNLADICTARGDTATTRSLIEAGLASWRTLGYRQGIGRALYMLAQLEEEQGDLETARARYEESLAVWREVGYRAGIAEATTSAGWLALGRGDQRQAAALFGESSTVWREIGNRKGIASALESCVAMAVARGQPEVALRVAGAAAALHEAMGTTSTALERSRLEPWLRGARSALGAAAAHAARQAGAMLQIEAAVAEAIAVLTGAIAAAPADAAGAAAAAFGLTPRELEVLRLVARHATDREIANVLSISHRTVMHHVSHILAKLAVASRRDAAAWATRHNIA